MCYDFDKSKITVCEDTARAIIYHPVQANKDKLIEYIDKNNFICVGVWTQDDDIASTFSYYFTCPVSKSLKDIKEIETTFT